MTKYIQHEDGTIYLNHEGALRNRKVREIDDATAEAILAGNAANKRSEAAKKAAATKKANAEAVQVAAQEAAQGTSSEVEQPTE